MLMMTCKQASKLVSQSLDRPLSWSERAQLKFHLFICAACHRFNNQLRLLSHALKSMTHETESDLSIKLSSEARVRINHAINSNNESSQH